MLSCKLRAKDEAGKAEEMKKLIAALRKTLKARRCGASG